ncbi:hypothetical protein [Brasilonema sp. UFV-L1]|uniref:hypothetical protein n=1 Tax=Brasilonema sp. UFV-L1 TaxID=2234130 RepID=UPI00145DB353|nr:hypothetical protein [Brasilonema sp. UFV-L1]NMG08970.1 hypothetical protein [Brasilonema sp. UFV-L1]
MSVISRRTLHLATFLATIIVCYAVFANVQAQQSPPTRKVEPKREIIQGLPANRIEVTPNRELMDLYKADQGERKLLTEKPVIDEQDVRKLNERDAQRRKRVLELYHANALKTGLDFYHAAMIFQHGDDLGDYLLAHDLAIAALTFKDKGAEEAKWLIAATQDRLLKKLGRPQRFGTQQITTKPNANNLRCLSIYNLDSSPTTVTDEHRQILNVPTLKQAQEKLEELNKKCKN